MKNTMTDLVEELEKFPNLICINDLISLAKKGEFHDYRSSQVCGKMFAVSCFDYVIKSGTGLSTSDIKNLEALKQDIKDGKYDEPCTKEDRARMIKEAENDPNISEKDKAFFISFMKSKYNKKQSPFGKRYF